MIGQAANLSLGPELFSRLYYFLFYLFEIKPIRINPPICYIAKPILLPELRGDQKKNLVPILRASLEFQQSDHAPNIHWFCSQLENLAKDALKLLLSEFHSYHRGMDLANLDRWMSERRE